MTHICVGNLTIIGSDNGLSPHRRQAIIWTNAGILLIEPLGTNFSENSIEILTFSFTKMLLKVSSAKWRPFCLGLNVLKMTLNWSITRKMSVVNDCHNIYLELPNAVYIDYIIFFDKIISRRTARIRFLLINAQQLFNFLQNYFFFYSCTLWITSQ